MIVHVSEVRFPVSHRKMLLQKWNSLQPNLASAGQELYEVGKKFYIGWSVILCIDGLISIYQPGASVALASHPVVNHRPSTHHSSKDNLAILIEKRVAESSMRLKIFSFWKNLLPITSRTVRRVLSVIQKLDVRHSVVGFGQYWLKCCKCPLNACLLVSCFSKQVAIKKWVEVAYGSLWKNVRKYNQCTGLRGLS